MEIKSPGSNIMVLKNETSIPDNSELRQLIIDNPGLPLIMFVGETAWSGDFTYTTANKVLCEIEELTLYNNIWMDRDNYFDKLYDDLAFDQDYENLSDEKYSKIIDDKVTRTKFVKAITVRID